MKIGAGDLIVLDTNVFIHVAKSNAIGKHILGTYRLKDRAERRLFSSISEGELFGLCRYWKWGTAKVQAVQNMIDELVRIDAGLPEAVEAYSELHAVNLSRGLGLGENDMWIAACAKAANGVVLTCDHDFSRIPPSIIRVEIVEHLDV